MEQKTKERIQWQCNVNAIERTCILRPDHAKKSTQQSLCIMKLALYSCFQHVWCTFTRGSDGDWEGSSEKKFPGLVSLAMTHHLHWKFNFYLQSVVMKLYQLLHRMVTSAGVQLKMKNSLVL